jgi:hypothetical protein
LRIFAIYQLPRFPNWILARKGAVEVGLQFASAPDSFHVQWFKRQALGFHICVEQSRNAIGPGKRRQQKITCPKLVRVQRFLEVCSPRSAIRAVID